MTEELRESFIKEKCKECSSYVDFKISEKFTEKMCYDNWDTCYFKHLESLLIEAIEIIKDNSIICRNCIVKSCEENKRCNFKREKEFLEKVYNKKIGDILK